MRGGGGSDFVFRFLMSTCYWLDYLLVCHYYARSRWEQSSTNTRNHSLYLNYFYKQKSRINVYLQKRYKGGEQWLLR